MNIQDYRKHIDEGYCTLSADPNDNCSDCEEAYNAGLIPSAEELYDPGAEGDFLAQEKMEMEIQNNI